MPSQSVPSSFCQPGRRITLLPGRSIIRVSSIRGRRLALRTASRQVLQDRTRLQDAAASSRLLATNLTRQFRSISARGRPSSRRTFDLTRSLASAPRRAQEPKGKARVAIAAVLGCRWPGGPGGPGGGGRGGGGGGGRGGPGGGFGGGGGSTGRRYNFSLGIQVLNLFNNQDVSTPNGTLTSQNFGRSTQLAGRPFTSNSALRQVSLQTSFTF